MEKEKGIKRFREIQDEQFNLHKVKNHDYAAESYISNLKSCEAFGINPLIGIVVRLTDKLSRLSSFCEQGVLKVKDEKIEDTLNDIAVYAILARIMYEQNDICLWKDLFYLLDDGATTFNGYNRWSEKHPLYGCVKCDGYDLGCNGYKSLKEIGRKK